MEYRMISRRLVFITSLAATAISGFTLGILHARRHDAAAQASYERELQALRAEVRSELGHARTTDAVVPAATIGRTSRPKDDADGPTTGSRAKMMAEIKQELQSEMGLLPVQLLRQRRTSFVELYSYDNREDDDRQSSRRIASVKVMYQGKEISAKVVDTGDADVEVHSGDWAIIKTKEVDLPALHLDTSFAYDFADPIFRLGNDYSKGIILSTGYVGQRTSNGLVTCLTDGHPGVSGGGVLNQHGDLVGIPIGRMQGDYRFSFILPLRAEMLRKLPSFEAPVQQTQQAIVAEQQ
ncbi:MAG: hypothetical protein DMG03_26610 [Acidobacteria bacterium]|nr:MAG: hypothetical protein DMG03_26610 [Acidobacteriota bacterium]